MSLPKKFYSGILFPEKFLDAAGVEFVNLGSMF